MAIVVVDQGGSVLAWSAEAERLTGHRGEDMVGKSVETFVPAQLRERHRRGFGRAMETGVAKAEGGAAAIPVLCADGAVRRFAGRFTILRDAYGTASGAAAVFREIEPDGEPLWELQ